MPGGRPRKFKDVEEMKVKGDAYFAKCDEEPKTPYTLTGLTLALGLCSLEAFKQYEGRTEFHVLLKGYRLRVQSSYELMLAGQKNNQAGPIFALKNIAGWRDTGALEVTGAGGGPVEIKVNFVSAGGKQLQNNDNRTDARKAKR
jgi:hypothetical protein